jgi:hypothetical protein
MPKFATVCMAALAALVLASCDIIGNNPQSTVESRLNDVAFIEMHNGMYGPERGRILYYDINSLEDPVVMVSNVYGFLEPAVSYDMRYIAYLRMPGGQTRYPRNVQLFVKNTRNGTESGPILEWISYYNFQMSWSPDLSALLIQDSSFGVAERASVRLLLYYPATGELEVLIDDEVIRSPEWSPRGDAISYIRYAERDGHLPAQGVILDMATRSRTAITPPEVIPVTNLKWSPNGRQLAFIEVHEQQYYVTTLAKDGSAFRRILKMGTYLSFDDICRWPCPGIARDPTMAYAERNWIHWLPNGNEIYVVWQDNTWRDGQRQTPRHRRVIFTLTRGQIREFMPSMDFHWHVRHFAGTGLAITAGKRHSEIQPHFYVTDDYGRGAVQVRFSGSSNGIYMIRKPTRTTQ